MNAALAVLLVGALQFPTPSPFAPDTVLSVAGAPRIVLLSHTIPAVASLRLDVSLTEEPLEAGAAAVLGALALNRIRSLAGPVGARARVQRTPWGLAYQVDGSAADLEYLAYLLRQAVAEPGDDIGALQRARGALEAAQAAVEDAPERYLTETLRRALAPGTPTTGTPASLEHLDLARLSAFWRRSHRPESMTLVAAAPVAPEVLLASMMEMGASGTEAPPPLDAPTPASPPPGQPDVLRRWLGLGWRTGPVTDPRGAVAAALLAEELASLPATLEARVRLEATAETGLLIVTGAAYPAEAATLRRALPDLVARVRRDLTPDRVDRARERVRWELLYAARTPSGLVAQLGRDLAASGDPGATARYLDELEALEVAAMADFLDGPLSAEPARAELR